MIPTGSGGIAGSQATENSEEYVEWEQRLSRDGVPCGLIAGVSGGLDMAQLSITVGGWVLTIPTPYIRQNATSSMSTSPKGPGNGPPITEKEAISELHVSQPNIPPPPNFTAVTKGTSTPTNNIYTDPFPDCFPGKFCACESNKAQTHLAGIDSARHNTHDMTLCILQQPSLRCLRCEPS